MLLNLPLPFYKWDFFAEMMLLKLGGSYAFCMRETRTTDAKHLKPYTPRTRPESPQLIIGFLTGASQAFTLARVRAIFSCFSAGSVSYDWLKLIPVYKSTPTWQLLSLHVEMKTETWAILPTHFANGPRDWQFPCHRAVSITFVSETFLNSVERQW